MAQQNNRNAQFSHGSAVFLREHRYLTKICIFPLYKNYNTNMSGLDTVQFPLIKNLAKSSVRVNPKNGRKWKQIETVGTITPLEFAEKMFPPAVNMCVQLFTNLQIQNNTLKLQLCRWTETLKCRDDQYIGARGLF
jgi:hypothetical protein